MANTKISDLGNEICLSAGEEIRIPALGNGIAKPGEIVGITDATGKVVGIDIGASELYRGILDKHWKTGIDAVITDGERCSIVVPTSGRQYRVWITDASGAVTTGNGHIVSTTAGRLVGTAAANMNTAGNLCININVLANGDLVMECQWL